MTEITTSLREKMLSTTLLSLFVDVYRETHTLVF